MPLPSSGTLTMAQINAEFSRGLNLNAYRGTTYYTSSGGPFTFSSGAISFSNFYGTQLAAPFIVATGGTVTTSGNYRIHTFTGSGTFTVTSAPAGKTLDTLIVAGGGSGGNIYYAGGGGAGGMLEVFGIAPSVTSYSVSVGAGGSIPSFAINQKGNNGTNSSALGYTAIGGGGGGGASNVIPNSFAIGANGGSGGGNGTQAYPYGSTQSGAGTSGQGQRGGYVFGPSGKNYYACGGGGGKAAAGGDVLHETAANNFGGAGGSGAASSMSGSSVTYAGGGGGYGSGASGVFGGTGGAGGGGRGGYWASSLTPSQYAGVSGTANTGGGGGACSEVAGAPAGNGGSGIVIIRYLYQ